MKNLALSLALAAMCGSLPALAENDERRFPNDHLSKRWVKYEQNTGGNHVRSHFFNDTVSVEEMTAAFYKHKDTRFKKSPYPVQTLLFITSYAEATFCSPLPSGAMPTDNCRTCVVYGIGIHIASRCWSSVTKTAIPSPNF